MINVDMAQVEQQFMAISAKHIGVDIHKNKASEIFNVPVDQVTDAQRKYAKTINYVELYTQPASVIR
ncbi:hypothetical protein [Ralstonia phage RP13]|nr:hypothetical protein [Ralstonia phage RP13]BCG50291.1 hypothetical protein [Ralstonia phage RP13]